MWLDPHQIAVTKPFFKWQVAFNTAVQHATIWSRLVGLRGLTLAVVAVADVVAGDEEILMYNICVEDLGGHVSS